MGDLQELESKLGYLFRDSNLLAKAVTHSSHAHEKNLGEFGDNEQLEFLGDAVVGFVVSDFLFRSHPDLSEGQLSKLKGFLVSAANQVKFAERLGLGHYLQLGKGEEKTGGRSKQALLVDGFEAVIGAVYLDGGIEPARRILQSFFDEQIGEARGTGSGEQEIPDFKTALAEFVRSHGLPGINYAVISETGPDQEKLFTMEVRLDDQPLAQGLGLTKRAAEQAAAREALEHLKVHA